MGKRLRKGFYWRGGVIWVRTDPIDKLPRSTKSSDPKAAELWRTERERIAANPHYAASRTASLGEWIVKTLDHKEARRSAGTLNMYEVKLGHFARIWGQGATLSSVTSTALEAYVSQRQKEGAKNNTIWREWTCLRQLLKLAARGGAFGGDLSSLMPLDFSADYVPVTRTLKMADLPKLWAALRNDTERAWVALALSTGADVGDVERARKEDYDAARNVMRVRGTKTDTRDAEVPILPHVAELFAYALERLPISWPRASNGVGEACKRAGIPHLSPKDLRRTAATWLVASGADQSLVSRYMRHVNDTMVRMVYGQISPDQLGTLLGAATSAIPLQSVPGPLAKSANAEDLKGDTRGVCRGAGSVVTATCGGEADATGAVGRPISLQSIVKVAEAARAAMRVS